MDKPIINPAWIWGIDALSELDGFCFICAIILGIALIVGVIVYIMWKTDTMSYHWNDDDKARDKTYISWLIKGLIVCLFSSFILIATPSKSTMYTILVTSQITQENLEIGQSAVEDAVDYIIEKVNDLQGNNENSEDTVEE